MSDPVATRWVQSPDSDRAGPERDVWLPSPGEVVGGRYALERVIGSGGMGAVVAARHLQLGEEVAVKFLHPRLAKDPASVERFIREARAASRIKSEHVIRVHDVGSTDQGLPYIAMELLKGSDLADLLARGPLAITLAVDCVLQAAEALAEAHAAGIVHRDVKPSNLWLAQRSDGSPNVKVLDFGISKLGTVGEDSKLTETRAVFGSPAYMSPEQIRSAKRVDHRTDIWALGVVLYELLSSRVPFEADNVSGVLAAITADPPRPLRSVRADAPATLDEIVLACLVKDPARRATLKDLAAALRPFGSQAGLVAASRIDGMGQPSVSLIAHSSPPPSTSLPSFAITDTAPDLSQQRPAARRPALLIAAIGGALALLGLLVVTVKVLVVRAPVPSSSAVAQPQAHSEPSVSAAAAVATPATAASSTPAESASAAASARPPRAKPPRVPLRTPSSAPPSKLSEDRH